MHFQRLRFAAIILLLSLLWLPLTVSAAEKKDPVALLKYVADNMISGLKTNKATLKTKPQIVYNLAYKYVVPHADLRVMAKQVLPANTWNNATPEQRAKFQKEFTKTLIRTYASALTSYDDQTVQFFPIRGDYSNASTVTVESEIASSQSPAIHVSYRLVRNQGNWKLFDMSVEGVSLLDSFRSQFAEILETGKMSDLLNRMSNHNETKSS